MEHAGFHRFILQRKPKRYDEYGDELSDDEEDEEADEEAADRNPYSEVHVERKIHDSILSARELINGNNRPAHAVNRRF